MLLGLAWHNIVLKQRQVVIKTAVIPSMNTSWARTQRGESDGWRDREGKTKRKETDRATGGEREVRVGSV